MDRLVLGLFAEGVTDEPNPLFMHEKVANKSYVQQLG